MQLFIYLPYGAFKFKIGRGSQSAQYVRSLYIAAIVHRKSGVAVNLNIGAVGKYMLNPVNAVFHFKVIFLLYIQANGNNNFIK
jgi:hypothetical protein